MNANKRDRAWKMSRMAYDAQGKVGYSARMTMSGLCGILSLCVSGQDKCEICKKIPQYGPRVVEVSGRDHYYCYSCILDSPKLSKLYDDQSRARVDQLRARMEEEKWKNKVKRRFGVRCYIAPPALRSLTVWSNTNSIDATMRMWTDRTGIGVKGRWISVSEDSKTIYVATTKENRKLAVKYLSQKDKAYIEDKLSNERAGGKSWYRGAMLSTEAIRENEYIEKAKRVIMEHDREAWGITRFRVFQALNNGKHALCTAWYWDKSLNEDVSLDQPIVIAPEKAGALADGDIRMPERLYWCGVYRYETVKHEKKTVNIYTDDVNKAISLTRQLLGLYDKKKENTPNVPQQRVSTSASRGNQIAPKPVPSTSVKPTEVPSVANPSGRQQISMEELEARINAELEHEREMIRRRLEEKKQ